MIRLNLEQQLAVDCDHNVAITACPGSGKTRVLTARVIRGLLELHSSRERVVALTFTNRAADEIQSRLDQENVRAENLWAGTIHAFGLDWVLRPYAPYLDVSRWGFSVADEYYSERLLSEISAQVGLGPFAEVSLAYSRAGVSLNDTDATRTVFDRYKARLREERLIDYDDILYLSYKLLNDNTEVAETLGNMIRLICVDEVQDIQDLQFGILSTIVRATRSPPALFFVGDPDQSIYESLGALTKTPSEIAAEFGLDEIRHVELKGNYRSTQRIIDFYRQFRPGVAGIESRTSYADHKGLVTFDNQTIEKDSITTAIASRVSASLSAGVAPNDICVLAPQWWQVRAAARRLIAQLPNVDFDAPGLSPLYSSRDNFWFKVARLLLTEPSPFRTRTRYRWAKEILTDFSVLANTSVPEEVGTPRRLLRALNALLSDEVEGLAYLRDTFSQLLRRLGLDLATNDSLEDAFNTFFQKAEQRILDGGIPSDVNSFRKLFSYPSGVVVSTCHAVKGEEYDTVIVFGLLRGYVPHWSVIMGGGEELALTRESKLLYVICSRAKQRLHLIAEAGRQTQRGNPYETASLLGESSFEYDED